MLISIEIAGGAHITNELRVLHAGLALDAPRTPALPAVVAARMLGAHGCGALAVHRKQRGHSVDLCHIVLGQPLRLQRMSRLQAKLCILEGP